MGKSFWKSKTIWVNFIAVLAAVLGPDIIDPSAELAILGVINWILRIITKEPLKWD